MNKRNNISLSIFLSLFVAVFFVAPLVASCGKGTSVSPSTLNIQYRVVNLSPDLGPVDLYIDYKQFNTYSFYYPSAGGYFFLTSIDTPFQIRPGKDPITGIIPNTGNIFSMDDTLKPNLSYTLFITGLVSDNSITKLRTIDTGALPATGRGKVRFVNVSPRSNGLDVVANGVSAFKSQKYLKVSKYLEMPAGNYDFQIFPTGSSTVLRDLQNVIIQDGRLYTVYAYGLTGTTDSLAFGAGVMASPIK
ncbi:MAG TPA: DUF4397 domain-containing protein [Mucilaginibacter sp.]|nr:DUF4397 domain-containing protein [Mucilaginibacter sp.]